MNEKFKHFMRFGHIPLLIFLQVVFIILFATFVDYDPKSVVPHGSIYAKKFKFDKKRCEELRAFQILKMTNVLLNVQLLNKSELDKQ